MTVHRMRPTWAPPADRVAFFRKAGFWRDASVPGTLLRAADRFEDRTAIRDGEVCWSFRDLAEQAMRIAAWLRGQGLQAGEAVLFQLPNWWEAAVVFHGIQLAGGVVVPVTPILRRREVSFILGQTRARFAFVAERFRSYDYRDLYDELSRETGLEQVVWVRAEEHAGDGGLAQVLGTPLPAREEVEGWLGRGDDVAIVIYTSGTTSDPKGAIHTHDGVMASTRMCGEHFGLNENDVLFCPTPVTHITGISMTFLFPVTFGCPVTIQAVWDPEPAFDLIDRDRTTFMIFATPFLAALTAIAESRDVHLDHIRAIACGGADVPHALARRATSRLGEVVRMYGATEAPNASCGSPWDPTDRQWGTEGRWLFPTQGRVVDSETGADVPSGTPGEAWVLAPQMLAGYVDASLNDDSFTDDGYFRTGDVVVVDGDGYVTFSGRLKDIINRGGEKISAKEVEDLILELPQVAEVAVTPMSDDVLGERVCAWAIVRDGAPLALPDVTEHLLSFGLAKQKLPERLEVVTDLPRTPSGKVRKQELRERVDAALHHGDDRRDRMETQR
jgi:cyclohexanecarboxylate-CoA ligase